MTAVRQKVGNAAAEVEGHGPCLRQSFRRHTDFHWLPRRWSGKIRSDPAEHRQHRQLQSNDLDAERRPP